MNKIFLTLTIFLLITIGTLAQKVSWTYTTETEQWVKGKSLSLKSAESNANITIYPNDKLQKMDGFGACFNELGWEALQSVDEEFRTNIITDLFSKEGVNFSLCRMPLGSNDYSLNYYSYNDVPEDFEMKNFNINRDRYILIPYIKEALKVRPDLEIWASPWVPPLWMKVNNHYAMGPYGGDKSISEGQAIRNNATAFKMENRYLQAYALYFSKFVEAYENEGIDISFIMVQNEPIYQPHWQSCTWRPEDLAFFIGRFLGPQFQKDETKADIWLGTVNSGDPNYARTILKDGEASKYIKGLGVQWDFKHAISTIHSEFPNTTIMQTESECGNGERNWASAEYTWSLINQYISNGTNSYMYWNMILDPTGASTWGWKQNAMITIDKVSKQVTYNPEYYLMKHLSHYVKPGAHRIKTTENKDHLAFINPNGEIVLMIMNQEESDKDVDVAVADKNVSLKLKAKSINTFTWMNN
ncbi:glycoside hydrolase family 30 protein [Flavobacteriaceae bacterium SZ-1-7]|uniref:glycoside hydrolase family 30 protein n=1 Tax=Tamlana sedimenti TaxID=3134126 RepID=UPI0031253576